jgi:hypothetical protein
MSDLASWIASGATMIAAVMTAANLGSRITGWGFVVFTVGSIAWTSVGILSNQPSLAITNAFLLVVNVVGVWRWLGRQARYEHGSTVASEKSRDRQHIPSLFSAASLVGAEVRYQNGATTGTIVDAMLSCDNQGMSYVVLSQGGIAGAGETLRAIGGEHFDFQGEMVLCKLDEGDVAAIPTISPRNWPVSVARAVAK